MPLCALENDLVYINLQIETVRMLYYVKEDKKRLFTIKTGR